jgi:hypothetical protein
VRAGQGQTGINALPLPRELADGFISNPELSLEALHEPIYLRLRQLPTLAAAHACQHLLQFLHDPVFAIIGSGQTREELLFKSMQVTVFPSDLISPPL